MGLDTRFKVIGHLSKERLMQILTLYSNFDMNATNDIKVVKDDKIKDLDFDFIQFDNDEYWWSEYGFIYLTYNGRKRQIFYNYTNIKGTDDIASDVVHRCNRNPELAKMYVSETTHLSLGYDEDAVKFFTQLAGILGGGWLDENDCDDKTYYFVGGELK